MRLNLFKLYAVALAALAFFLLGAQRLAKSETPAIQETHRIQVSVQTRKLVHTMGGGIGASWHAISAEPLLNRDLYEYTVPSCCPRGSAWGGNPPVQNEAAWRQLEDHATWLGLDWLRVELSQRMYEPERGRFDWDNDEMKALYRILRWCDDNKADVFLQQMWGYVEWNSFPGVHPLISAPRSLDDFAEGIAELLNHLVNVKGFRCIKWFCVTNEPPGGTWASWWETGSRPSFTITPALRAVRRALDRRQLDVPLSGPDWTDLPALDPAKIDFDPYIGAYDIHSYHGTDASRQERLAEWAVWAHARNKPFFLSEMGDMRLGWREDDPNPKSFAAALSNAETVIRGLRVGVDAFNRWSFVNRGDLDGQWQLVWTWDREQKRHLTKVVPETTAFYGYAALTRFLSKHSSILADTTVAEPPEAADGILTVSLISPKGYLTTLLLNQGDVGCELRLTYSGLPASITLVRYLVTEEKTRSSPLPLEAEQQYQISGGEGFVSTLPPRSITVFTTYELAPNDPGAIAD